MMSLVVSVYIYSVREKTHTDELNALLKENDSLKQSVLEKQTVQEQLYKDLNVLEKNTRILAENNLDCFWAVRYQTEYEDTLKHFSGKDYKDILIQDCVYNTVDEWKITTKYSTE